MLTEGRTDGRTDAGRKVITIAHPEQSSGELKIDFQDGHHLGFPIRMILPIFISTSHPDASNQLALWFRKISEKKSFKMAAMTAILDFQSKQFKLF